jgi:hypothetical protein
LHSIFLNIGLLHSYNLIFLSNLTQRVHSWSDSQPVADVFLMLVRVLFFVSIIYCHPP